jgi:hypothetical protein
MYVDLLTQALGKAEEGRRSNDLLLADLAHSRARLHTTDGTTSVAEALAREVSYDAALIRLCESLEVPATPAGFAQPERERTRLEQALSARGIPLDRDHILQPLPA